MRQLIAGVLLLAAVAAPAAALFGGGGNRRAFFSRMMTLPVCSCDQAEYVACRDNFEQMMGQGGMDEMKECMKQCMRGRSEEASRFFDAVETCDEQTGQSPHDAIKQCMGEKIRDESMGCGGTIDMGRMFALGGQMRSKMRKYKQFMQKFKEDFKACKEECAGDDGDLWAPCKDMLEVCKPNIQEVLEATMSCTESLDTAAYCQCLNGQGIDMPCEEMGQGPPF